MTTITHEARHAAPLEWMLEMLRTALAVLAPAPQADEDDIDWEDGEPEDETRAA